MNGTSVFLDTNIILYLLDGDETLAVLLDGKQFYISIITELELLSYKHITPEEQAVVAAFISECKIIEINDSIKKETIRLRKDYGLKLPDCIIISTALYLRMPMVTSDAQFKRIEELPLLHYQKH